LNKDKNKKLKSFYLEEVLAWKVTKDGISERASITLDDLETNQIRFSQPVNRKFCGGWKTLQYKTSQIPT